ncbi:MAG: Hpt domain-containing protein [Rhodoferax sp.]|nr:Hpt domain-containing protein [Rhodoferax sp.]
MSGTTIDMAVFAELQEAAGAEFVGELVGTFFEEAPGMLVELRAAQVAQNADAFRRAAHSLKSNSNTFGATRLAEMARDLELGGVTGSSAPLDALEASYTQAAAALKALCNG